MLLKLIREGTLNDKEMGMTRKKEGQKEREREEKGTRTGKQANWGKISKVSFRNRQKCSVFR